MRKPYYRKSCKAWYVFHQGKQVRLGSDKDEALKAYHALMAGYDVAAPDVLASEIIAQFLDWSKAHQEESTYKLYRFYLLTFADSIGKVPLKNLKPFHITRWLDARGYKGNTANGAVRAAVRPFNWAKDEGIIKDNPISRVKRPPATPRECYITEAQYARLMSAIPDQEFRDFVTFLRETGCRPIEARKAEARHFEREGLTLTFARKESKGKKRQRVIVLTPTAAGIIQRLVLKHSTGALFRNLKGRRWTRDSINSRFQRLSDKLKFEVHAYALRHTWVTDALLNGVEPLTVATLAGHTSINMIWEVYNKIRLRQDHMRKAAVQAAERKQA
jgi:integrase